MQLSGDSQLNPLVCAFDYLKRPGHSCYWMNLSQLLFSCRFVQHACLTADFHQSLIPTWDCFYFFDSSQWVRRQVSYQWHLEMGPLSLSSHILLLALWQRTWSENFYLLSSFFIWPLPFLEALVYALIPLSIFLLQSLYPFQQTILSATGQILASVRCYPRLVWCKLHFPHELDLCLELSCVTRSLSVLWSAAAFLSIYSVGLPSLRHNSLIEFCHRSHVLGCC